MSVFALGIDPGENMCGVVGLDAAGAVLPRRRLRRGSAVEAVQSLRPEIVAMDACCGAQHLGRVFEEAGFEARLMSPEYARPYVKAQKNDDRDAEATAEAAIRPTMRFAPVKDEARSDVQALHRARARLIAERTALIDRLPALLPERGGVAPAGRGKLEELLEVFADEDGGGISPRIRLPVEDLRDERRRPDARIAAFDEELARLAREDEQARRRAAIPGVGVINATASAAAVGDAKSFARGRDPAAWLGLTPRQATAGGKLRLLGISKRGDRYLRANLIHGAGAALRAILVQGTPLGRWARALSGRTHENVVVVALAAKLARLARAVLRRGRKYDPAFASAQERVAVGERTRRSILSAGGEGKMA